MLTQLQERVDLSKTCMQNLDGKCSQNGYLPFDCIPSCPSYMMQTQPEQNKTPTPHVGKRKFPVKRGDVFYADLSPVVGSEQGGCRPVVVIQNDVGNKFSPTVIVASVTSSQGKSRIPTHVEVTARNSCLSRRSTILLEQIRTIDKTRLREKLGELDAESMLDVDRALVVSVSIGSQHINMEGHNDDK